MPGLLFESDPPRIAYWLACIGIGIYLTGTRAFLAGGRRVPAGVRVVLLVATFLLAKLGGSLEPRGYLFLLAAWTIMCAVLTTRTEPLEEGDFNRYVEGRPKAERIG